MIPCTEEIIQEWAALEQGLPKLKARELFLRKQIVASLGLGQKETKTLEMFNLELKAVTSTILKVKADEINFELTDEEKLVIKWTPSVNLAKFKKLTINSKLRNIITIHPATAKLAVISILE